MAIPVSRTRGVSSLFVLKLRGQHPPRKACYCRQHRHWQGRSPTDCQQAQPSRTRPEGVRWPTQLPVTVRHVHFSPAVDQHRRVIGLNLEWEVSPAHPHQGVWVTLTITPSGATLSVFAAAPQAAKRTCLAKHPFPLKEELVPLAKEFRPKRQQPPAWFDRAIRALGSLVHRLSTMS